MLQKKEIFVVAIVLFCLVLRGSVPAEILFEDDFEAETLGEEPSRWEYDPDTVIAVKDIAQIIKDPVEGDKCMSHYGDYLVGDETWSDYIVEWDWMREDLTRNESVSFRYQDGFNFYHLSPRRGGEIIILYRYDGSYTSIAEVAWQHEAGTWYRFQIVANGDNLSVKIKEKGDETPFDDIEPILEATDATYESGKFGTGFYGPIDDVLITDLEGAAVVRSSHSLAATWGLIKRHD